MGSQENLSLLVPEDRLWAYKELINRTFFRSVGVTVGLAGAVAILSGVTALILALFLAKHSQQWKWLTILLQLPIGIPHLLSAYLFMQVLMQSGWYARIAFHFGWIDSFEAFPVLVHDEWGLGVILAYMWKEVPFIVLLIYPFIVKLLSDWSEQSKALGSSFSQTVRWVVVPIVLPMWVGGMWVVFAFTLGAYEIPALLGKDLVWLHSRYRFSGIFPIWIRTSTNCNCDEYSSGWNLTSSGLSINLFTNVLV